MAQSVSNPQISDPQSPLETLAMSALRRFGSGVPGSVDGDTILMFIEFANLVIEDVRAHPYYVDALEEDLMPEIDYYVSATDSRPIPDDIMVAGLLYYYAAQQLSQKAQVYMPNYARVMATRLLGILRGHGPISLSVVDDGSRGGRS